MEKELITKKQIILNHEQNEEENKNKIKALENDLKTEKELK